MKLKRLNHVTLAEGEATGHSHQAKGGTLLADPEGALVLQHSGVVEIEHQEHECFLLPTTATEFDVAKVREFDHAAEAVRNVQD